MPFPNGVPSVSTMSGVSAAVITYALRNFWKREAKNSQSHRQRKERAMMKDGLGWQQAKC